MMQILSLVSAQGQVAPTEALNAAGQKFINTIANDPSTAPQAQKDFTQAQVDWSNKNAQLNGESSSSINNGDGNPTPTSGAVGTPANAAPAQAASTPASSSAPIAQSSPSTIPATSRDTNITATNATATNTTTPNNGTSKTTQSSSSANTAGVLILAILFH